VGLSLERSEREVPVPPARAFGLIGCFEPERLALEVAIRLGHGRGGRAGPWEGDRDSIAAFRGVGGLASNVLAG
jgi:hypothetical protein